MHLTFIFVSLLVSSLGAVPIEQRKPNDGRIVGGIPADISNYPYQVSLEYHSTHNCGASIISRYWVVTAGHCAYRRPVSAIRVRAGSSYKGYGGSVHPASEIIVHPQYKNLDYDIAVIKVSVPFEYSRTVQPISLSSVAPPTGTAVIATGWGRLSPGGAVPSQLQQVQVNMVDFNVCFRQYISQGGITNRMICAGVPQGGKDACQGDSGGPLVANGQLVGIVSWGKQCALKGFAGIYADVPVLKSWVISVTGVR